MKVQKKVLDMNQDELDLVFIAIFGYKYSKLSLEEMQEEVIKWLIAKKLSLQHHFIFYEDSDEMPIHRYLLTKNNEMPCKCCENISMTYGEYKKTVHSKNDLTNFDDPKKVDDMRSSSPDVVKTNHNRQPDTLPSPTNNKNIDTISLKISNASTKSGKGNVVSPITTQPMPGQSTGRNKIAVEKKKGSCRTCYSNCCSEFGSFCFGVMGSF